jgi:PKD repeat protein
MRYLLPLIALTIYPSIINAQYCIPQGNCTQNDVVQNFTFHSISNLASGGSNCGTMASPGNAYINTSFSANVVQGTKYAFTVQGGGAFNPQGFGIWIDFNADLDFDDAGEFVFASVNPSNAPQSDSIYIPFSATLGSTRMRVRSLRNGVPQSNQSCTRFNRGETEDYTLNIQTAPIPPLVDFSANVTFSCGLPVQFKDLTPNSVTSRLWRFGDGNTSTSVNPSHTYALPGTYTVTLVCTNAFGIDSMVRTNYITVAANPGLATPQCTPANGTSSVAGFGITTYKLHTLTNPSPDSRQGYEDYSCQQVTLIQGNSYLLEFGNPTAPAEQNLRAWIDFNGDGIFTSLEQVVNVNNQKYFSQMITIPGTVLLNTSLRVRVAAVYSLTAPSGSGFTPCATLTNGQMEDYSIRVSLNTQAPVADFASGATKSCDGTVNFSDASQNIPTTWLWNFGDGQTSTLRNPTHTYAASGTYSVKLKVSNLYGSDSITKNNFVTVALGTAVKNISCKPATQNHREDYGIHSVLIGSINNLSIDGRDGYQDFSCSHQVKLKKNQKHLIEVKTGSLNNEDLVVWIDWNDDGVLDNSTERAVISLNDTLHADSISIPAGAIGSKPLRMRISSDVVGAQLTPCDAPTYGQIEDYAFIVDVDTIAPPVTPVAGFQADIVQSCDGKIKFTDKSTNSPTSWLWDFGDGKTSNAQNPQHTYASFGKFTVKLTASNAAGADTETKTAYIDVDEIYCTGINDRNKAAHFSVYPNPAGQSLYLRFADAPVNILDISLFSILGEEILLKRINVDGKEEISLDVSAQPRGVYFLRVRAGEDELVKRIVLN